MHLQGTATAEHSVADGALVWIGDLAFLLLDQLIHFGVLSHLYFHELLQWIILVGIGKHGGSEEGSWLVEPVRREVGKGVGGVGGVGGGVPWEKHVDGGFVELEGRGHGRESHERRVEVFGYLLVGMTSDVLRVDAFLQKSLRHIELQLAAQIFLLALLRVVVAIQA